MPNPEVITAFLESNPDSKEAALLREGGLSHSHSMSKADMEMKWDAGEQVKKADIDDMKQMHAAVMGDPKEKGSYVLPHHMAEGEHKVVWAAVQNAAARFNQVEWDSEATKKAAAAHLRAHYKQFDKEPPEALMMGEKMKKEEHKESLPPEPVQPSSLVGSTEFRLSARVTEGEGNKWKVLLVEEGHSLSGRYFAPDVLRAAAPLFEGARSYMNHPDVSYKGGDRPVQDIVGYYTDVKHEVGKGLTATWHILSNSQYPWLPGFVTELSKTNKLNLVGLSLLGLGKAKIGKVDGKLAKITESIDFVRSVDLVDVPGAGGKVESIAASAADKSIIEELEAVKKLEEMTPEELKESNPGLYEKIRASVAVAEPPVQSATEKAAQALLEKLEKQSCAVILSAKLSESGLPVSMQEKIKIDFSGKVFEPEVLDKHITVYRESLAEILPQYTGPYIPTIKETVTVMDKVQAAFDKMMGNEVDAKFAGVPPFHGIREAYLAITGDTDFKWESHPERSLFREALPTAAKVVGGGTITFANILNTSMNKRVVKAYAGQPKWWEPIVVKTRLDNLKQQDRNRPQNFGSLTERTTGGAEYTELTWAETQETFSPTEYGNTVPIAQRAIINDDLRALQQAPVLMAKSAVLTLNEYVSNLFTQGSGTGPALADGVVVFHNASHQGNTDANALGRANFSVADKVIRKMLDDASKRMGLYPEFLLIPPDLREIAYQLAKTPLVPDSANNAANVFFYDNLTVIVVPNWTDVNNWYTMAGPKQIELIEMGFLFGQEEPEIFVQANPEMGMAFTHDVLTYKIRHRYGGDWLDYRGAYAGLPA